MSIRATQAEIDDLLRKTGGSVGPSAAEALAEQEMLHHAMTPPELIKPRGRVQQHKTGKMNKTELTYSQHLDREIREGRLFCYWFEAVKLRLADNTWLTVDFVCVESDGVISFREVKGTWKNGKPGWKEDARVKWKVAAEQFPCFPFLAVWKVNGIWEVERYGV